jgi:hypothetical protein
MQSETPRRRSSRASCTARCYPSAAAKLRDRSHGRLRRPGIRPGAFPGATSADRRDRRCMRKTPTAGRCDIESTISGTARSELAIDMCAVLGLLRKAVSEQGEHYLFPPCESAGGTCFYAVNEGPPGIVGTVLSLAQVRPDRLEMVRERGVSELYREGRLLVPLTLGALVVLDAAQRSQDRGHRLGKVLELAWSAADHFLDMLPDAALGALDERTQSAQSPGRTRPHGVTQPRRPGRVTDQPDVRPASTPSGDRLRAGLRPQAHASLPATGAVRRVVLRALLIGAVESRYLRGSRPVARRVIRRL